MLAKALAKYTYEYYFSNALGLCFDSAPARPAMLSHGAHTIKNTLSHTGKRDIMTEMCICIKFGLFHIKLDKGWLLDMSHLHHPKKRNSKLVNRELSSKLWQSALATTSDVPVRGGSGTARTCLGRSRLNRAWWRKCIYWKKIQMFHIYQCLSLTF